MTIPAVIFFFIFVKLIFAIMSKHGVFLSITSLQLSFFALVSSINIDVVSSELLYFIIILEVCETIYISYIFYRRKLISRVYNKHLYPRQLSNAKSVMLLSIPIFLIVFQGFDARVFYEYMVEENRGGGFLLSIIMLGALFISSYAYSMKWAFLLIALLSLTGSKGMILSVIVFYICHQFVNKKLSLKSIFYTSILFFILFQIIVGYTRGVEDIFSYYVNNYFMHLANFDDVKFNVPTFPNANFFPLMNDFFPGFSRVAGVAKNDLHSTLFPSEFAQGVALGMLNYEVFFRTGVILFFCYYLFKIAILEVYLRISCHDKMHYPARALIILGSFRLFIILVIFSGINNMLAKTLITRRSS